MIHNCACRIILGADNDTSVRQMHQQLEIPTLNQRQMYHQNIDCFNNINNAEAGLHKMYKNSDNIGRTTRRTGTKHMVVRDIRSCVGRKAYSYEGPNFWNTLDSDTRCMTGKEAFKRHINKIICRDVNHPGWVCEHVPVLIHDWSWYSNTKNKTIYNTISILMNIGYQSF